MKIKFLSLCVSILLLNACSFDDKVDTDKTPSEQYQPTGIEGMMTIKLQPEILESIDNRKNELAIPTGNKGLDQYLESIGAYKLKRIFPFAGKHEQMQISENLNAWYTVWVDNSKVEPKVSISSGNQNNSSSIIAYIEPVYEPRLESYTTTPLATRQSENGSISIFNDPLFFKQWNLFNNGAVGNYQSGDQYIISSIAGADINMISAWEQETGNPDVIVSIVDGGVDIYHEDLKDNLWVNQEEIPGNGIDDDNNGYIDDVHGYNFVDESANIEPHDHGTHVAGVIAAKNNNGKGISSIAGGNGKKGSGVRIMSSQIFKHNPNYNPKDPNSRENLSVRSSNHTAAAIVYGANNGAVISQNSWGYDVGVRTPKVVQEAIDYFNKYAGHSKKGKTMMQGGLVVFAASNDNTEFKTYPAAEPNVISVAAYGPDFSATWYTNYGDWIDISAPGGSSRIGKKYPYVDGEMTSGILSTIISEKGQSRYGYMQGTSMAAPHVSGIASLIVSKYGHEGYTREQLKQRLLTSVKKVNANNYNTKTYYDKLGKGFIDARAALTEYDNTSLPPKPVFVTESIKIGYDFITLAWKSTLTASQKSTDIESYIIYMSQSEITPANYQSANVKKFEIPASYNKPEDVLERTITDLKSGTPYYFAIKSFARNGSSSELIIHNPAISTSTNRAPIITSDMVSNKTIELAGKDILEVVFTIKDPENHNWDYVLINNAQVYYQRNDDKILVRIFAEKYHKGSHKITLRVTDQYGAQSSADINFTIKVKEPPRLKSQNQSLNVSSGESKSFDLKDMILDEQVTSLKFKIKQVENTNISVSLNNSELIVNAKNVGASSITIIAEDKHGQQIEFTLPVFVYKNTGIYSLYPTKATTKLYVKLGEEVNGEVKLRIRDVMGKQVLTKSFNTSELDPLKRTYLLDINSLNPGRYEFNVIQNNKTYKEYFVKE